MDGKRILRKSLEMTMEGNRPIGRSCPWWKDCEVECGKERESSGKKNLEW